MQVVFYKDYQTNPKLIIAIIFGIDRDIVIELEVIVIKAGLRCIFIIYY